MNQRPPAPYKGDEDCPFVLLVENGCTPRFEVGRYHLSTWAREVGRRLNVPAWAVVDRRTGEVLAEWPDPNEKR